MQRAMVVRWCYEPANESRNVTTDETEPSLSLARQTLEELTYLFNGPITAVLVLIGVLSVSLSLSVLLHARRRPLIYLYLIAVELWNLLLLSSAFLLYCLPNLLYGNHSIIGPYAYSYLYSYVASNASLVGTVWTVLALTVDRYVALCHPLRHKALVTRRLVLKLIAAVALFSLLFTIPRYFELQVVVCQIRRSSAPSRMVYIGTTPMRESYIYGILYKIMAGLLFYSFLPFVIILLLTIRIALELRRAWLKRRTMSRNFKEGRARKGNCESMNSNAMLVAVSAKFLLSHTMPTVLDLGELVMGHESFAVSFLASFVVTISNFLLVVNASTNLWIYAGWGSRFRQELKVLLLRSEEHEHSPTTLYSNGLIHSRCSSFLTGNSQGRLSYRSRQSTIRSGPPASTQPHPPPPILIPPSLSPISTTSGSYVTTPSLPPTAFGTPMSQSEGCLVAHTGTSSASPLLMVARRSLKPFESTRNSMKLSSRQKSLHSTVHQAFV